MNFGEPNVYFTIVFYDWRRLLIAGHKIIEITAAIYLNAEQTMFQKIFQTHITNYEGNNKQSDCADESQSTTTLL